jgi:hypothetical protein
MLRPTVSLPVYLGIKHPSGAYDRIFITVGQLRVCWCGAVSLTRGRVCCLQLLLGLDSAVILGSEYGYSWPYFTSQIPDFPFRRLLRLAGLRNFSESESKLCYDRRFSRPVYLGIKHPSGAYDRIFITVWQLRVCWCGAFSLTRGRVCGLQLLLGLASAVILGSESLGTVSDSRLPFSSPPTICGATVEVFYNSGRTEERPLLPTVPVLPCFIRCYETCVNHVAILWLLPAYPLPRNVLTEPLPNNGLFRLSGVMSQYERCFRGTWN